MSEKARRTIITSTVVVVGLYFLFAGLRYAQGFLAPVATAILLALLMIPVSRKLEKRGISRGWSAFICDLIILSFFAGLFFVVSLQVQNAAEQWPQMKQKIQPKVERLQQWIGKHTSFSVAQQDLQLKETVSGTSSQSRTSQGQEQNGSSGKGETATQGGASGESQSSPMPSGGKSIVKGVGSAVLGFFGFLGTSLLTLVYIFFFLLYRRQFRNSILNFVPEERKQRTDRILGGISSVTQNYLLGKLILIICLAILYSVGLSISGVKQAILISILAAVLSLVPYIGNIIGFVLALALGMFSGGGSGAIAGIAITFAVAQFVESYVLEPYIVGEKVKLHPVFTIIAVIIGEQVWGVIGMVIGIPLLAVVKVIADHVPVLHPLGYALGEHKDPGKKDEKGFFTKVKQKFLRQ